MLEEHVLEGLGSHYAAACTATEFFSDLFSIPYGAVNDNDVWWSAVVLKGDSWGWRHPECGGVGLLVSKDISDLLTSLGAGVVGAKDAT